MKNEFFVTVTNLNLNDGSTMGPYNSREECKNFIKSHNKTIFKNPSIVYISDNIITYKENNLKIKYEIFVKNVT